ncbi:MAG: ATPase, T2SS/T4P/T4SS family [Thermodesulfobacteriota bacterium]
MRQLRKKLGELIVEAGLLSREQLDAILAEQRRSGLRLGQFLIQRGHLKEQQIVELISRQLRIDVYAPDKHPFDVGLDALVPVEFAQKHRLAPIKRKGSLLRVCMVDPMDIEALDTLEVQTRLEADPLICTEHQLQELTYAIYGLSSDLGEVMEDMEGMSIESESGEAPGEDVAVTSLQEMADEAPVVRLVNSILSQAVRERASDVHISPEKGGVQLRFRVDGKLREAPAPPKSVFLPIVSRIKILANMDIAVSRVPQDGRFTFTMENREVHVRASSLPTIHGENLVLRLLYRTGEALDLPDLGLDPRDLGVMSEVIEKPWGMILATGPTGSGKTTTLYALLKRINKPDINIITLEDPVEYRVGKIRQVQLNRKAGMTFASGLRSILRQDPDTIMVGEIRDAETAGIAVQAALTGHQVLSTLHTNDAAGAVTRLIEMGVEPFLVSSTLLLAVAQRLVRRNCPHCLEEYLPPESAVAALGLDQTPGVVFKRGKGCYRCNNSAYMGRTGVYEVLPVDEMVQDMILRRASSTEIGRAMARSGRMRTLKQDAARLVAEGVTSLEEAASVVLI